jgi:hypothetical protein
VGVAVVGREGHGHEGLLSHASPVWVLRRSSRAERNFATCFLFPVLPAFLL